MKTWQKIRNNPQLLKKYLIREEVVDIIRIFFKKQGFHEVFTPILVPVPSIEPNLEVFDTELITGNNISRRGFLIMSPEYAIKKLLAAGIGSCFEITKAFRNKEEISNFHNPEFTILEWYRVGADYKKVMEDFENLFREIISETRPQANLSRFRYQGEIYDLTLPWPRISVKDAFNKFCGIDTKTLLNTKKLIRKALEKGYETSDKTTWEQVFYQIFFNEIEPKLKASYKPAFIYDYPLAQAALAQRCKDDFRFAERFEVFLAGLELGNCFSELTDAKEQEERFNNDLAERKRLRKTKYPIDSELIEALKAGMPKVSGIAVGVDRLVMLAADLPTISETLFFPAKELFDL
jgi:lysyl-tRNA synthetase class 2